MFKFQILGFQVQGLKVVQGLGFKVQGLRFRVEGLGFLGSEGLGFRSPGVRAQD